MRNAYQVIYTAPNGVDNKTMFINAKSKAQIKRLAFPYNKPKSIHKMDNMKLQECNHKAVGVELFYY